MKSLFAVIRLNHLLPLGISALLLGSFASNPAVASCINNQSINQAASSDTCYNYQLSNSGTTVSIQNNGTIGTGSPNGYAITSSSSTTISSLTNTGTIGGTLGFNVTYDAIFVYGTIGALNNSGSIIGVNGYGIENFGRIDSIVNNGSIVSNPGNNADGIYLDGTGGSIGVISNTTSGSIIGDSSGIENYRRIDSITNAGSIVGTTYDGIYVNGSIGAITNSGSISGGHVGIEIYANIDTITNTGTITGGSYGIFNGGFVLATLNNGQGGTATHTSNGNALTYHGTSPQNYNIIITSTSHYGQLINYSSTGTMAFGISALSTKGTSVLGNYSTVLNGITSANLGLGGATTSGTRTSNGYTYILNETGVATNIWDLNLLSAPALPVTGPSTADTQQSLVNTSAALQNTFTLQNSVLANSFSYDCNVFGTNDVCVSAGGRNTQVSAANGLNNTSALLIAAYRPHPNYRIGAYADQNLSANNAGSTVNLGNNTPLIGLFGAWNERLDGTGTEVKVSAAYGQKNTTVTRQVVGTSEAGSGSSQLNSQGAQVTAKYGFGIVENVIVSPYVGMRYTQNNMNGYSEQATSSVTAPLTYSALNTNATTALAGVGASYRFIPQATAFASAGVETDTNTSNGTYSATGVAGLTPINFNANPVRTRPTATLGAYYDIEKNQRVGITGIYRQEPYQAVQTTTVLATYTIGL
jgi:Autotransporter beta-domain